MKVIGWIVRCWNFYSERDERYIGPFESYEAARDWVEKERRVSSASKRFTVEQLLSPEQ